MPEIKDQTVAFISLLKLSVFWWILDINIRIGLEMRFYRTILGIFYVDCITNEAVLDAKQEVGLQISLSQLLV